MAGWAVLGIILGVLSAYLATRRKKAFRRYLLSDLARHRDEGGLNDYVRWLVGHRAQWEKPLSIVRKPFRNEINLVIETAGFILALMGLITSLSNFEAVFASLAQGVAVMIFLGMIAGFIPFERMFSEKIEGQIDSVLAALKEAREKGTLECFIANARDTWK
jgi:hypothetical protein